MLIKGFDEWLSDIESSSKTREPLRELYAQYTTELAEYSENTPNRESLFINGDPNEGYKFHLNVKPTNVRAVSAQLKLLQLEHKYLSGGEIESGKVFTVYTGSKENTEKIVKTISDNEAFAALLEPTQSSPNDISANAPNGEVPFAPNIYGRFVGDKNKYLTKVPRLGISILRGTEGMTLDQSYQATNEALLRDYGEYYGGGITYYQPKATTH